MADISLERKDKFEAARVTSKIILGFGPAFYRRERRSLFVLNPATGTLEVRADLRLKVEHALRAEARRLQLRLYLSLSRLYLRKIGLQVGYAGLQMASKLCCNLFNFAADRHR